MNATETHDDRMGTLFNDFLAAAEAIKQRPVLEAKVSDAESAKLKAEQERDFHAGRLDDMRAEIDRLNAKTKELEAALSDATFREKEIRDQRQVLLDAFRGVVKEVSETVELVEPTPKPEVVASVDPTVAESVGAPMPGILQSTAIGTDAGSNTSGSTSDRTEGQSVTDPTGQSVQTIGGDISPTTEAPRNTGTGPFAPSMDGKSADVASADPTPADRPSTSAEPTTADTKADVSLQPKPYSNRPHWQKPDTMTWREWKEGGGEVPLAYDLDETW